MDTLKTLDSICSRVNDKGCRVVIPATDHSPITAMFDGEFCNAEFDHMAGTLYLYGMSGNVSFSRVVNIERASENKYVITCGDTERGAFVIITIANNGGRA